MNIQPSNQQPISDDQELAKVLAGVTQQADDTNNTSDFDVSKIQMPETTDEDEKPAEETTTTPEPAETSASETPEVPELPDLTSLNPPAPAADTSSLDSIKQEALTELRPLVDKLEVSAEEKFDTYLLLLRSTDDQELIAPAHEAARSIADEARRAQALLDIIKEIDYLSSKNQQA